MCGQLGLLSSLTTAGAVGYLRFSHAGSYVPLCLFRVYNFFKFMISSTKYKLTRNGLSDKVSFKAAVYSGNIM